MNKTITMIIAGGFFMTTAMASEVTIIVPHVKDDLGTIRIAVFEEKNAEKFPSDPTGHRIIEVDGVKQKGLMRKAKEGEMKFKIDLPDGVYALAGYQDINDDGRLNKIPIIGLPIEAYGFSNRAIAFYGPPSFNSAKFKVEGNTEVEIEIE